MPGFSGIHGNTGGEGERALQTLLERERERESITNSSEERARESIRNSGEERVRESIDTFVWKKMERRLKSENWRGGRASTIWIIKIVLS